MDSRTNSFDTALQTDAFLPAWVIVAAQMPVAFAQVREDALLDLWVVQRIDRPDPRVIAVASGGCTAAALAASGRATHLHLVDINSSQIALTRLKLYLLETAAPHERAELLGHVDLLPERRAARLADFLDALQMPHDVLGPLSLIAELGADCAGRYELLFAQLRAEMREYAEQWTELLGLADPTKRAARVAPTTDLGRALTDAFECVMALPNLVRLFSEEATRNSREPFSCHFARRTRHALATSTANENPYLWQMLMGRFPEGVVYPWLDAPAPQRMPTVTVSISPMDAVLAGLHNDFDYVHLSNILDWLTPEEAHRILQLAYESLRPGGYTLVRQLNSTLDIPSLCERFEWLSDEATALHARDRSFFYRSVHLGRKR